MCNSVNILHGGVMMTFCDFSAFVIALEHTVVGSGRVYVTLSMNLDFVGSCKVVGKGQIGSALMGSLRILCYLTE